MFSVYIYWILSSETRLKVPDLTPNIGLFWYFFTEMFDHFYLFFTYVFQLNPFIYVIPLALRFEDNIPLLSFTLCTIMAIFKSYPSIGDVGFYLSLLPIWNHLVPCKLLKFLTRCFNYFLYFNFDSFQAFIYRRMYNVSDISIKSNIVAPVDLSRISKCQFLFCYYASVCNGTGNLTKLLLTIN